MTSGGKTESSMLGSVKQAIVFGVPNQGMQMSHLLRMVKGQPNEDLIRLLTPGSNYLSNLDEQFTGVVLYQQIQLVSVYETSRTRTFFGKFLFSGDLGVTSKI